MVEVCLVAGPVVLPDGEPAVGLVMSFFRIPQAVTGQDGSGIVPETVEATIDEAGDISVSLVPGTYYATCAAPSARVRFYVGVPDQATAVFSDCVAANVTIDPDSALAAMNAAAAAQEALSDTIAIFADAGGVAAAVAAAAASEGAAADSAAAAAVSEAVAAAEADRAEVAQLASQTAATNAQRAAYTVATWTLLATITGSAAGIGAEVLDSDTGTHTDPVAGGTVANAGRYSWSASPAGWLRIGDTGLAAKADAADVDAKIRLLDVNGDPGWIWALTGEDSVGAEQYLGGLNADRVLNFPEMLADRLTSGTLVFPDGTELYMFETLDETAIMYQTDAEGRIIKIVRSSGDTPSSAYAIDDIRYYQPDIALDGLTDESVRLKAAHDAAFAAGVTRLYIEGPIYAPTAEFLGEVLFLTQSGLGRLVGTFGKVVVPVTAPTFVYESGIIPERHLKNMRAKLATATAANPVVVVYMSDSWGQPNEKIGPQEQFEYILGRVFRDQFGPDADKIRIVNRAVGGTTWTEAKGGLVTGQLSWVTANALWTDYVVQVEIADLSPTTREPDVVMFMFTQNYDEVPTAAHVADMHEVIDRVTAALPDADVIMLNASVPSTMSDVRGTKAAQEGRQSWAALQMAYADVHRYGKIDLARAFDALHRGFDPRSLNFRRIVSSAAAAIPYTFPQACTDFAFSMSFAGATNSFWAQGDGKLTINLSVTPGNVLILEKDGGGNIAYTINAATGVTQIARTVSGLDAEFGASTPIIEVSALGSHLMVLWRNQILYNGPVERCWSEFTPSISYGAGGTLAGNLDYAAVSEPRLMMPSLTNLAAWGFSGSIYGGNGQNHLSALGRLLLFVAVLSATRFGG